MFGEYAHIASFLSPRDEYGNSLYGVDAMPEYLRPSYNPPHPWSPGKEKSGLAEDFIMIAEFSELEGPKPLMTIPKEGVGVGFDQNSFAVRILAVDHQTSSSQGFSISEDAQVVLSDVDDGVFAFVHHFVLYDNTARGFVRPHCIAYITSDQRKLMTFYEEMSSKFKKVARLIKYGNLLIFMADLERHLKDLEHTKGFLLNQVSKQRLKDGDANSDMKKNADSELHRKLQSIHQSTSEIKEILSILKPLQSDKRLEARFRLLEERAFRGNSLTGGDKLSLQENWFNDLSSLDGFDVRCGSLREPQNCPLSLFKPRDYKPLLVETKKAKRFNAPLRGLHELCSWGAKEGLKKLRSLYAYFKRDMVLLELEKMESKLMRPTCTSIYHGQCVTGNLLAGIHIKQYSSGFDGDDDLSMLQYPPWASSTSLDSTDSFKSADSFSSGLRANNASPGSGHTNESLNGHMFQSAPSSLDKHDISLLTEDEYYGQGGPIECSQKSVEEVEGCEQLPRNEDVCEQEGNLQRQIRLADIVDEDEEAPIIIFREKIKRPLSVVSLGCTDDENDSPKGSLSSHDGFVSSNKLSSSKNMLKALGGESVLDGRDVENKDVLCDSKSDICNFSAQKCCKDTDTGGVKSIPSSMSDNRHQDKRLYSSSPDGNVSNCDPTLQNNYDNNRCDKSRKVNSGSSHALSLQYPQDSPTMPSIESITPVNEHPSSPHPSCTSQTNSDVLETNSVDEKTVLRNCSMSSDTHGTVSSSISTSSSIPSSLSSTTPQSQQDQLEFGHQEEECDSRSDKCIKSTNNFLHDNNSRKGNNSSASSHMAHRQQHTSSLSSSPASSGLQRQTSTANSSQSDFTDISIRELFPYLTDPDSKNSALPNDMQSTFTCSDNFDSNEGVENAHSGTNGINPSIWRPHHGLYTVGDWLNNINRGRTGYGISEVLNGYSNLQHVVYSLMTGRPVLVVGVSKMEPEVLKIVNALAVFIPSTKRRQQYVLEWTSKHLRISDLSKLQLIGLCRDDRKSLDSFIPSAVKKASTVIDVEKRMIFAPHYQGQLIPGLIAKKKNLKTDAVMLSYIHWWLMDILGKAFIFFHSFYLGSAGSMMSSANLREHRDSYRATVNGILGRLGIKDSDCSIVEYLAELTKMSRLESCGPQKQESDTTTHPLTIHYTPCQTFKC